jgi:hypothetical protein
VPRRPRAIPVETPFDEYEHMRALRCACGGAFDWGERECTRAKPRDRHVLDRFELECRSCGEKRAIEFRCDTRSRGYEQMTASALGVAAGLGPESAIFAIAADLLGRSEKPPSKPKKAPRKRSASRKGRKRS